METSSLYLRPVILRFENTFIENVAFNYKTLLHLEILNRGDIEFFGNEILKSSSVDNLVVLSSKENIFIEDCYIDHSENEGPSYIKLI